MPAPLFQPGQSGNPSGRKGKAKHRSDVAKTLQNESFCPFKELIKIFKEEETTRREKITICVELASYIAPKLRSVEVKNDPNNSFAFYMNFDPNKKLLMPNQTDND